MVTTAPFPQSWGIVVWPTIDISGTTRLLRDARRESRDTRCPQRVLDAIRHLSRSVADETNAEDTGGVATSDTAIPAAPAASEASKHHGADPAADGAGFVSTFDASSITMEDLIKDHADAVYRVALSVTRDPALAEDVSQDSLIKAWQALPTFRGASPLRNWVLRITHNTAISTLRRRRDELRPPELLPERVSHTTVESQVQDRLAIVRFEEALGDLDDVSRSIVVLREVEGLSYSELCEVLDLPMPTVKTRLLRARRQLARALEGWQP